MKVIEHQAIGAELPTPFSHFQACFGQGCEKIQTINIVQKEILPPIPSVHNM